MCYVEIQSILEAVVTVTKNMEIQALRSILHLLAYASGNEFRDSSGIKPVKSYFFQFEQMRWREMKKRLRL